MFDNDLFTMQIYDFFVTIWIIESFFSTSQQSTTNKDNQTSEGIITRLISGVPSPMFGYTFVMVFEAYLWAHVYSVYKYHTYNSDYQENQRHYIQNE